MCVWVETVSCWWNSRETANNLRNLPNSHLILHYQQLGVNWVYAYRHKPNKHEKMGLRGGPGGLETPETKVKYKKTCFLRNSQKNIAKTSSRGDIYPNSGVCAETAPNPTLAGFGRVAGIASQTPQNYPNSAEFRIIPGPPGIPGKIPKNSEFESKK